MKGDGRTQGSMEDQGPPLPEPPEPVVAEAARPEIRLRDMSVPRGCTVCGREREPYVRSEIKGRMEYTCRSCFTGEPDPVPAVTATAAPACAACSAPLEPTDAFCGVCGAPAQRNCGTCGKPYGIDDGFCGKCGRKL